MTEPTHDGPTIAPPPPRPLVQTMDAAEVGRLIAAALAAQAVVAPPAPPVVVAPAAPAAPATDLLAQMGARLDRLRRDDLVQAVRGMGLQHEWSRERILALVPDVDVGTDAGKASLETWRKGNADLFASATVDKRAPLQAMIDAVNARAPNTPEHPIFGDAYVAKVFQKNLAEDRR